MKGTLARETEEELRGLTGEKLIQACGKLAMLDRLLLRLKKEGSRVLLFSQFTETLDVLEEYVNYRFGPIERAYLRLDGQTNRIIRELNIRQFNAPNSSVFVYLISTKAGGVGVNLATADSVVLYDSSWNPQADLQAQDRAHRIGQTKQVTVYRLITKDSIEERIDQMSERKMILDRAIIAKDSTLDTIGGEEINDVALTSMIGFGAAKIMNASHSSDVDGSKSAEQLDADLEAFIRSASTIVDDHERVDEEIGKRPLLDEDDCDDSGSSTDNDQSSSDGADIESVPSNSVKIESLHKHFLQRPTAENLECKCNVCGTDGTGLLFCEKCNWTLCEKCGLLNDVRVFFPNEEVKIPAAVLMEHKPLLGMKFLIHAGDSFDRKRLTSNIVSNGGELKSAVKGKIDYFVTLLSENADSSQR